MGFYKSTPYSGDWSYFYGEISELNIWSKGLLVEEMINITRNCGNLQPTPDILNWYEDATSFLNGNHISKEVENLCYFGNPSSRTYKTITDMLTPDHAMHSCNVLKAELAYPKNSEDWKTWNGKSDKYVHINLAFACDQIFEKYTNDLKNCLQV